jgi:transcriptional regulator with XRE-family HTH domain
MEGKRLRQRRKELKLSGEAVAKALGTTRVTVSRWESGESDPSDKVKIELAKVLNTTIAYLMGETDSPERNKVVETGHIKAGESDPISYGYWGNVADNARDVAVSGDKDAIAYVSQMLKRALSLLTVTEVKDVVDTDMGSPRVTNMPVMVGKRNENTVTFATA